MKRLHYITQVNHYRVKNWNHEFIKNLSHISLKSKIKAKQAEKPDKKYFTSPITFVSKKFLINGACLNYATLCSNHYLLINLFVQKLTKINS